MSDLIDIVSILTKTSLPTIFVISGIFFILLSFAERVHIPRLFSWDDLPGNDNERLIEYLAQRFGIDWITKEKIEKIDDGSTIKLNNENNSILLKLNNDKTKVNLKINDGRTYEFIAKIENNKLNIYHIPNNKKRYLRVIGVIFLVIGILLYILSFAPTPPPPPEIRIIDPREGEIVSDSIIVSGTISGVVPKGQYMWLVINPQTSSKWWPQGQIRPLIGHWNIQASVIGENEEFEIAVALVNPENRHFQ